MINNNLKSELPFGPDTNKIILNCTNCENSPPLFIKSKTVFRELGHRGGEDEIPYLFCRKCKMDFTSTEKILEGFLHMSRKFNEPDFDPSNEGKQRFIYQGFNVDLYNRKINEAYDKENLDSLAFWMEKQSFEVAKAMYYLNIHYWKHFSSCFKYSKKRDLSRQTCRYRKPDWPKICNGILTLEIGNSGNILTLGYTTNQRNPYIYLSESVTRFMISFFANHCVKLVTDAKIGFYFTGYCTKAPKQNLKFALKLLNKCRNNVFDQKENIEEKTEEKISFPESIKNEYTRGLQLFSRLSTRLTNDIMVGQNMAGLCVLVDDRFIFSPKFSYIVTFQYISFLEEKIVYGMLGNNNKWVETISHYSNRHTILDKYTLYEFKEHFEVVTIRYLAKNNRAKILKHMRQNDGVYVDEIYLFFLPGYTKYKTHLIRRLPSKRCPVIYGPRVHDLRKLDLPSTSLQKFLGETGIVSGIPYLPHVLDKKRKEYAQHMLIVLFPWRSIQDFNIEDESDWWKTLLLFRENGKFSNRSLFVLNNLQCWNDAFLCRNTGQHISDSKTDNIPSSDEENESNVDLCAQMHEQLDIFVEEKKAKVVKVMDKKSMVNPKKIDKELLAELKQHDFDFSTDSKFDFTVLDQLNEAKNFRNRNVSEIQVYDPISRHFKLFSQFDALETKSYFLALDDVVEEIDEYRSPEGILPDPGLFQEKFPSLEEMGRVHGLDITQFKVFSIYGLKMVLRMLEQIELSSLPVTQQKLKKNLSTFFKNLPLRGIMMGPAGTGKSRVLGCFFHWLKLWGLSDRIFVSATTGAAAILLSKWIRSYTHFGATGIFLDTSGDNKVSKGQLAIWAKIWIFVLDEVSMLSASMIDRLDRRIQVLTGNKDMWYGNLDTFFAGDYFQLPPVGGYGLYSNLPNRTFEKQIKTAPLRGVTNYLNKVIHHFYLTKIYRSNEAYADVLNKLRICKPSNSNIRLLNNRLVTPRNMPPNGAVIIVPNNNMRTTINDRFFYHHIETLGIVTLQASFSDYNYCIVEMHVRLSVERDIQPSQIKQLCDLVRNFPEQNLKRFSGYLKVFIGCPMMCTNNTKQEIGIANGTMCTLAKIIFKNTNDIEYVRLKNNIIVPFTSAKNIELFCLEHKNPQYKKMEIIKGTLGFFSLRPMYLWSEFQLPEMKSDIGTGMTQLPCVTAFAVTGHKTQGATLGNIFVCGYGPHGNGRSGWLYVVMSRVRDISNIYLLKKLTKKAKDFRARELVVLEDNRLKLGAQVYGNQVAALLKHIESKIAVL